MWFGALSVEYRNEHRKNVGLDYRVQERKEYLRPPVMPEDVACGDGERRQPGL